MKKLEKKWKKITKLNFVIIKKIKELMETLKKTNKLTIKMITSKKILKIHTNLKKGSAKQIEYKNKHKHKRQQNYIKNSKFKPSPY